MARARHGIMAFRGARTPEAVFRYQFSLLEKDAPA